MSSTHRPDAPLVIAVNKLRVRVPWLFGFLRSAYYNGLVLYGATIGRLIGVFAWPRYRGAHPVRRLQMGCARRFRPGWYNTDKYPLGFGVPYLDAGGRYPFENCVFDYIFTEHMIEHLPYGGGQNLVRESFRVLKPGGKIRIATPDLDRIMALRKPATELERRYIAFALESIPEAVNGETGFVLNRFVRAWGHSFIYDKATLPDLLRAAGFVDIRECEPGISHDPDLTGLEHHHEVFPDAAFNQIETMVFEATKPAA